MNTYLETVLGVLGLDLCFTWNFFFFFSIKKRGGGARGGGTRSHRALLGRITWGEKLKKSRVLIAIQFLGLL